MQEAKEQVVALIDKCLTSMPIEKAVPESYMVSFVAVLYQIDEAEKAAELGLQILEVVEQKLNYFTNIKDEFYSVDLLQYFFDAYGQLYQGLNFINTFKLGEDDVFRNKVMQVRNAYVTSVEAKVNAIQTMSSGSWTTNMFDRFRGLLQAEKQMLNPKPVTAPAGNPTPVPGN